MRNTISVSLALALLAGVGFSTGVSAQTVYKSVDDEGHVAFTDRPPLQYSAGDRSLDVVELEIERTNPARVAASRSAADEQARTRSAADAVRKVQQDDEAARAARKAEERAANCELATQRLNRYATANRLYKEGADGERVYLNDQEIDAERIKAARAVDEWCGN